MRIFRCRPLAAGRNNENRAALLPIPPAAEGPAGFTIRRIPFRQIVRHDLFNLDLFWNMNFDESKISRNSPKVAVYENLKDRCGVGLRCINYALAFFIPSRSSLCRACSVKKWEFGVSDPEGLERSSIPGDHIGAGRSRTLPDVRPILLGHSRWASGHPARDEVWSAILARHSGHPTQLQPPR